MSAGAGARFALRGRNPDVLTCIANLSNDEVFTPPEFANQMLDTARRSVGGRQRRREHLGRPDREVPRPVHQVRRLPPRDHDAPHRRARGRDPRSRGARRSHPDQAGLRHRRSRSSRACSLAAASTARSAPTARTRSPSRSRPTTGNIWFERMEHTWVGGTEWVQTADENGKQIKKFTNGRCRYCGASQRDYDRGEGLETHAYAFIHTDDIKARIAELFGGDMQFDVIIGNPPYQLGQSGGDASAARDARSTRSSLKQAKALDPRYVAMVIPVTVVRRRAGLDEFRQEMLADRRLRVARRLSRTRARCFPGVDINGRRLATSSGTRHGMATCEVTTRLGLAPSAQPMRRAPRRVRHPRSLQRGGLDPSARCSTPSGDEQFESLAGRVAPIQPFSIRTNFRGSRASSRAWPIQCYVYQNGGTGYIERAPIRQQR